MSGSPEQTAKWKLPPDIKIYEALGAIADGRVELEANGARVFSSSRRKSYTVTYSSPDHAIMANDNGSYWQGYVGYPAIAYLLMTGVIPYDARDAQLLRNFDWKRINQVNKNDWDKTIAQIRQSIRERDPESDLDHLDMGIAAIGRHLKELNLSLLGPHVRPPAGD